MTDIRSGMLSRRKAIGRLGILTGAVISAPVMTGVLSGCRAVPPGGGYIPQTLDANAFSTVSALSEVILPTTETPGAIAAGVPAFIDQMLTTWFPEADRIAVLNGIRSLNEIANVRYDSDFPDASEQQQQSLVGAMASTEDDVSTTVPPELARLFIRVKELTVVGYYTSEIGATQELRQMPLGVYRGDIPYDEVGRAWT